MPKATKAGNSTQVRRLREALAREKAKSAVLAKERAEAREQQAASAAILKVISRSPDDAHPVFEAIVKRAVRLIGGHSAVVLRFAEGMLQLAAFTSTGKSSDAVLRESYPRPLAAHPRIARVIRSRKPYVISDTEKVSAGFERTRKIARARGYRSVLDVPLLRRGEVIGTLTVTRKQASAFTKRQINLLQSFAAQAVIAIENARLFNDTKEALERQTATGEILRVISGSPANIQPVFDAIAENAARFCGAVDVLIHTVDGSMMRRRAHFGPIKTVSEARPIVGGTPGEVAILERRTVHVDDMVQALKRGDYPGARVIQKRTGLRTILSVPLMRENAAIGVISMRRQEVRPFTTKEVELAETFAAQAVIAIENVRLFNETKEGLERQTATAEILRVISSSPTDTQPVFDTISQSASQLCESEYCYVFRFDGNLIHLVAQAGTTGESSEAMQRAWPRAPNMGTAAGRAVLTRSIAHVPDVHADPGYDLGPVATAAAYRSTVAVPMLRDGVPIGTINLSRSRAGAYSDRQIDLLQTFADQAVIAIENARLFNETKEALERQTATSEILRVIASSPSDVQPVFDAIAASSMRLIKGQSSAVTRVTGDMIQLIALTSTGDAGDQALRKLFPLPISHPRSMHAKVARSGEPAVRTDAENDPDLLPEGKEMARARGYRSDLVVPMLQEGAVIGAISVTRREPGDFDEHQVNLLKTFADQAVIAIENVRLFNETKEALERQTATADILKVIAGSPTDVQPVFEVIVESAVRLCGARFGRVYRYDGSIVEMVAGHGLTVQGMTQVRQVFPRAASDDTIAGRVILTRQPFFLKDIQSDESVPELSRKMIEALDTRSQVTVPMLRAGESIGAITMGWEAPGAFDDQQVALLQTFADQAVIAIENVRLFNETKDALERQTATGEILRVIAGSPSDVQPVFDAIVRSAGGLFNRRASLRLVEQGGIRRRARSESAASDSPDVLPIDHESLAGRVILDAVAQQVTDTLGPDAPPYAQANAHKWDFRANAAAPLIRDGTVIGLISVASPDPGALSDKQMALLATFADQAVIAIENVRLFNETKEALERQTATAEILKVISATPTDVRPVLDAVASSAARLCEAKDVAITLKEGDLLRYMAHQGEIPTAVQIGQTKRISNDWTAGRAALEGRQLHIRDVLDESEGLGEGARMGKQAGYRTVFATPLLRHGAVIGVIVMRRGEVRPFEPRQIELVNTFAEQAVIAIENVRLFNETKEALERQTATAEILQVIGGSPTDTQPVFDAIVNSGVRLFPGAMITVARPDGGTVQAAAIAHEDTTMVAGWRERFTTPLSRDRLHARAILDAKLIDLPDAEAEKDGLLGPGIRNFLLSGNRAVTIMPMLRGGGAIGAISVTRTVPGALSDKQIAILRTFADQAVIAIENVRLFNETKEALERQTATSEVLNVIARSPSDVQPVLDAVAESAARLCGASDALIMTSEAGMLVRRAHFGPIQSVSAARPLTRGTPTGRAVLERCTVHVEDVLAEIERGDYLEAADLQRRNGMRTILSVPLVREDSVIGVISMRRLEVRPFTEKQIALVKTFADQAVIAIENVRLFNETKESLERQTATAEILKVIASSPSDVQPVFDAIAASARRLLGGHAANVARRAGDVLELAAFTSTGEAGDSEISRLWPAKITGKGHMGMALLSAAPAWLEDIETDLSYSEEFRAGARARGMRSAVSVPMLREGEAIGVISVNRSIPGRFSDHQTNLLRTFADQAVIAIENVRLFNETQEALARQEAAAQVLRSISESVSDTAPVFTAILDCCNRLIPSIDYVQVQLIEGSDRVRLVDHRFGQVRGAAPGKQDERRAELMAREATHFPRPLAGSTLERALNQGRVVILADTLDGPDTPPGTLVEARRWGHSYSQITVPLMREGRCIGAIEAFRRQLGGFEPKERSLLESFADQAVIAIENVRLFKELETRTTALGKSVEKLTALGEVGQAISSTLDLEKVLKTIATHAVQLTGLDGASIYEYDEASEAFRLQAADNQAPEVLEAIRSSPIRKGDGTVGRVAITLEPIQVADILDESYRSTRKDLLVAAGYRAVLTVPLLREDRIIGALSVTRKTPGPFSDEIVELLKTFATQSAMAIQNARLFREIAEKGKQLEEASKHKSQFLASMSHELRTPLNAILGFNEMILGDIYGEVPADMKEPLTDIQTSGKHLLRLINNVLDLAKIEAGRMELALDDYSVHDTVESVRSTLRPLAEAKGLELAVSVPPDIPLARGDGGRITQCLMNLAGNSLKFTKQGSVGISVALNNGTLTYKVQDTGIGIPADKIGSLFTEFKQTDATIASEYGGTGLGLSITKKFIEMHGGRIWAESQPGSGSTFIFEVPLRAEERGDA